MITGALPMTDGFKTKCEKIDDGSNESRHLSPQFQPDFRSANYRGF
jgi:hypothetical protein